MLYLRVPKFPPFGSVCCACTQRTGAAARAPLQLARLPRTASSAQRSRRLRFTRAAAPVLLAHAEVTKNIFFQWVQNLGTRRVHTLRASHPPRHTRKHQEHHHQTWVRWFQSKHRKSIADLVLMHCMPVQQRQRSHSKMSREMLDLCQLHETRARPTGLD